MNADKLLALASYFEKMAVDSHPVLRKNIFVLYDDGRPTDQHDESVLNGKDFDSWARPKSFEPGVKEVQMVDETGFPFAVYIKGEGPSAG